jgi:two-component sensor histidine kinase
MGNLHQGASASVRTGRRRSAVRPLPAEREDRVQSRTAELLASLRERDVLLQELHHRVKNNLQVISSLINMQVRALETGASRDALVECEARVHAIALIHEKLYESRDYARVPFAEYARDLAADIFHAASPANVSLELAVEDVAVAVGSAIPCGLILNELITNALKHAFPDGRAGTVRVEMSPVNGTGLRLAVEDDGRGLPAGFDVGTSSSLGLHLVRMLAGQLDASLEVEATRGTCFRVTVPGQA